MKTTKLMPIVDLPQQYYIVAPGYIGEDARPDPLQYLYGNSRVTVFNLEGAPAWLFYMWICELARKAGIFHLFTEQVTRESCADRWHAVSVLVQLAAMYPQSSMVTNEIYRDREQALEAANVE